VSESQSAQSESESEPESEPNLVDRKYGPVTVLFGAQMGKYPQGNSVLIQGSKETALVDPSLGVLPRRDSLPKIDRLLFSHCHEDHLPGAYLFPDVPWHFHELDLPGIQSLEGFMAIYGFEEPIRSHFQKAVIETFHFVPNPASLGFSNDDVFDLGGVRVQVVHAPGHTRGHSCFLVESDEDGPDNRFVFLGDIDLSGFGPYYGDAWSDLEDFEKTIDMVRDIDARWYGTFHHIGVLEREAFLERLDRFAAQIHKREAGLLEFLSEPHDIAEIAAQSFIYSRGKIPAAEAAETRSMIQHVNRLLRDRTLEEESPGRWIKTNN
jgi:glyoxylase-like metal-dependent hydrolase (beta-lactamase superfamily II)